MKRLTALTLACATAGLAAAAPASADRPDGWIVTARGEVKDCAAVVVSDPQDIGDTIRAMKASDWFDAYGCKIQVTPVRGPVLPPT